MWHERERTGKPQTWWSQVHSRTRGSFQNRHWPLAYSGEALWCFTPPELQVLKLNKAKRVNKLSRRDHPRRPVTTWTEARRAKHLSALSFTLLHQPSRAGAGVWSGNRGSLGQAQESTVPGVGFPVLLLQNLNLPHAMCVLSCFSHVWLCNPKGYSPPGSSVHGILQARTLEWVPCPPPGHLPDPGTEPASFSSPALAGRL